MKQHRKFLYLLGILIVSAFASTTLTVSASGLITWSQTTGNGAFFNGLYALYDNDNDTGAGVGDNFTPTYSGYLDMITVKLLRVGSPDFVIHMAIQEVAASTSKPTGAAQEVSATSFAASSISNSGYYTYMFEFAQTYQLQTGHYYCYYLYVTDFVTGAYNLNWIKVCITDADVATGGVVITEAGSWIGAGASDREPIATIYVQTTLPATPTPSPVPTSMSGNYWDNWANQTGNTNTASYTWINTYLPFAVPLILILACGFLGYKFGGFWGFFAGINLGVIVGYAVFPTYIPLWAIVIMVIVDGLLLFGKVSASRGER